MSNKENSGHRILCLPSQNPELVIAMNEPFWSLKMELLKDGAYVLGLTDLPRSGKTTLPAKPCWDEQGAGEKVNSSKSRIVFSNNVRPNHAREISDFLEFTSTADLGKCLGVQLHHKRVSKSTYQYILNKMDRHLSTWKANTLSLAARKTLVSSVVAAIPVYTMQSTPLPSHTCEEIDKGCRRFLWGATADRRKMHAIAWDVVFKRKDEGGLGLREAQEQNKAYMMKLGWSLINRRDALWVRLLAEKYRCGVDVIPKIESRHGGADMWRGIRNAWEETSNGIAWQVRSGDHVKFWTDCWVPHHEPLITYATKQVPHNLLTEMVACYLSPFGGWNTDRFVGFLPDKIVAVINGLGVESGDDLPRWKWSNSGAFTTDSTYRSLCSNTDSGCRSVWRLVWKAHVPQRHKTFIWLCMQGRLMTNALGARRGIQSDERCSVCIGCREDIMHVLRDCELAAGCWDRVVPTNLRPCFHSSDDHVEWLKWNLSQKAMLQGIKWDVWFIFLCRQLWLNRNLHVFQKKAIGVQATLAQVHAMMRWPNTDLLRDGLNRRKTGWQAPEMGLLNFIVDGACQGEGDVAACGGVARNHLGELIAGFSCYIGYGSSLCAELLGDSLGSQASMGPWVEESGD